MSKLNKDSLSLPTQSAMGVHCDDLTEFDLVMTALYFSSQLSTEQFLCVGEYHAVTQLQ